MGFHFFACPFCWVSPLKTVMFKTTLKKEGTFIARAWNILSIATPCAIRPQQIFTTLFHLAMKSCICLANLHGIVVDWNSYDSNGFEHMFYCSAPHSPKQSNVATACSTKSWRGGVSKLMFRFHSFHVRTDKLVPPANDQWILVGGTWWVSVTSNSKTMIFIKFKSIQVQYRLTRARNMTSIRVCCTLYL